MVRRALKRELSIDLAGRMGRHRSGVERSMEETGTTNRREVHDNYVQLCERKKSLKNCTDKTR